MIADDTFYDMAERLADDYDYDKHGDIRAITFAPAQFLKYSRKLIALAQQVKPLVWFRNEEQYLAQSLFGVYSIKQNSDGFWDVYLDIGITELSFITEIHSTPEQAIAFANEDYQRRVLSCLVHGGV